MNIVLIHNPGAGDEQVNKDRLISLIQGAGHEVVYRSSKEKSFLSALEVPGGLIVVAGGDGTVRKVALKLAGNGIPITILPVGTANNISRALGVTQPIEELIERWTSLVRKKLYIGYVKGPFGEARFIESIGFGLFSKAMSLLNSIDEEHSIEFDDTDLKLLSDIGALKAIIAHYSAQEFIVRLDGVDLSDRYLLLEAMNISSVGPNLLLAPDADLCDEYLDIVLIGEGERQEFADYLTSRVGGNDARPNINVRRGRKLEVYWNGAEVHIDDRVWTRRFSKLMNVDDGPALIEIGLQDQAVEFLVPEF